MTLIKKQSELGHQTYQISNGFFSASSAVQMKLNVETRSRIERIKNILWLRNFIRKQNIHIIHTHSRAAAKLGFWATLGSRTALISTVHGVQHSSFSKKLLNQYGQFIIAVCENIKNHLVQDFSYATQKIHVIPNPISEKKYSFSAQTRNYPAQKIAIIGRTTGPKKNRTEQVCRCLLSLKQDVSIHLIGGHVDDLNLDTELKKKITQEHASELNSSVYSRFDLIIGSGRVAFESLISGTPTIAFGEASYEGLIQIDNFSAAAASNFGDISPGRLEPELDRERFIKDLHTPVQNIDQLAALATNHFASEKIFPRIMRLYESAYFLKNYHKWIPVLMYHKIPDQALQTQHKIYVTAKNFRKHLKFFKSRGFQTLTFSELEKFRKAEKSFSEFPKKPLILTFDDGYVDNLQNASPLLKEFGFKAQIFLLADAGLDSNKWDLDGREPQHAIVSQQDRQKWLQSNFEISSHGFSHQKITEFTPNEAKTELLQSKISLEKEFNIKVNTYAFTYGITTPEAAELALQAGYSYAVNTDTGGFLLEEAPYAIFRVNIFPDENFWSLFKKTSSWYRRYYFNKRGH